MLLSLEHDLVASRTDLPATLTGRPNFLADGSARPAVISERAGKCPRNREKDR
jgi:hypothetical protein